MVAGIAVAVLAGGAAALVLPGMAQRSYLGSGYVAKHLCSCVFVAGRELAACRADLAESSDRVSAELLPAERAVRAWVPLLAERRASYTEATGCTLE
jgi:hypothetical protein